MEWLGWRGALWTMAGVTLALAIAIAGGRKVDKGTGATIDEVMRGVASVARHRILWPLLAYAFACSGVFFAVRGIWGGPYLDRVFGLSPIDRGNVLALMVVVLAASNMGFGWLSSRLDSPRPFILGLTAMGVAVLVALALAPDMPLPLAAACLVALGLFAGSYGLIVAHARAFFPKGMEGRGATLLNFFNFLGTATIQVASGETMAMAEREGLQDAASFGWMYALLAAALTGSLLVYLRSADPRRA
jgi:predicted MFS family arabinose efflux permease